MNDQDPEAHRAAPRYPFEKGPTGRSHCRFPVHLVDLSASGALIEFGQYMKPGTELALQLPLGTHHLKVVGTVVHCSLRESLRVPGKVPRTTYRIGVQFSDLVPEARRLIQDLIKERLENDRREQPRLYVGLPAQLEETIELRAINLGERGGLFATRRPMEFGSQHDFVFTLPNGEVRARGVVRHCEAWAHDRETRFQVGVEFVEFSPKAHEKVLAYLKELESKDRTHPGG